MNLRDDILYRIFAHKEMQKFSCILQSTISNVIEEVLLEVKEENPDATITELFRNPETE